LRPGDVIVKVNDQDVQNTPDLIASLDAFKPQSKVNLRILRGERELDAIATLASRDSYVFHQARYSDDRERGAFNERSDEDDAFGQIPPHVMQLEHDRRMAEQHERIETELRKLQEEVRLLREALQRK
jgi:C-terminal processing protease CtpA/Prc